MSQLNQKTSKSYVDTILGKLHDIQPGFRVQRFIEFPGQWIEYGSREYEEYIKDNGDVNHREILDDEIVIDVDCEDIKDGEIHANMVEEKIKEHNLFFKRYKSGGKGQHFHLIFPELPLFFDKEYLDEIKYLLIEYLFKDLVNPNDLDSHICLFKKKLIQIEGAKHRKGGTKRIFSYNIGLNNIPCDFYSFLEIKIARKNVMIHKMSSIPQPNNLNCVNFLEGKTINGLNYFDLKRINYRALFSLASYYKSKDDNVNTVKEKLMVWYNNIPVSLRRSSLPTVSIAQINNTALRTNGSAGCFYRLGLLEELNIDKTICRGCPYVMEGKDGV